METINYHGLTIRIEQDEFAGDDGPRDWDNVGTMVCFHSRYNLGDKHSHKTNSDFLFSLAAEFYDDLELLLDTKMFNKMVTVDWAEDREKHDQQMKAFDEARDEFIWKAIDKHYVILPLGLYDHSGITMYVGSQPSPFDPGGWDSGQVGWIYASAEKGREEFGRKWRKRTKKCLESEVEVYDQLLTGDVWMYSIEDEDGQTLDSLCGMYGFDYAKQTAQEAAETCLEQQIEELDGGI